MGSKAPVVQLQQSDAEGDHHWPFPAAFNARGRIDADQVLDALDRSGADEVALILEVIPPFEQDDDQVLDDMVASARYWRDALARHGRQTRPQAVIARAAVSAVSWACGLLPPDTATAP